MPRSLRACAVVLSLIAGASSAAAQSVGEEVFDAAVALKRLRSTDIQTRKDALWLIDRHRKQAGGLVDALVAALADPDLATRYAAAYVLTSVDPKRAAPALPILKAMLRSDVEMNGSSPRILAPIGLGRLGRAGADALVDALADRDPKAGAAAAQGLMNIDDFPPAAVPALIKATRGPDPFARHQALVALTYRMPPAERVIPALLDALLDPEADMRVAAAAGLGRYQREAIRALEALRQTARDVDGGVAITAASAIALIDRQAGLEYVPMFIAELTRPETGPQAAFYAHIRLMTVAAALGALGPDAGRALPALNKAFEREHLGWEKLDLGVAIALIDPKSAGPVVTYMIDGLENGHDDWRLLVLARLPELGANAAAAVPAVSKLTSSADPMVREAATKALAAIRR